MPKYGTMTTNEKIEYLLYYENWRSLNQHKFGTNIEMIEEYINKQKQDEYK